jgi:hypothetical protein
MLWCGNWLSLFNPMRTAFSTSPNSTEKNSVKYSAREEKQRENYKSTLILTLFDASSLQFLRHYQSPQKTGGTHQISNRCSSRKVMQSCRIMENS